MKRLFVFPLTLGFACALWLPISSIEAMLGTWLPIGSASFAEVRENMGFTILPIIEITALPCFIFGCVVGLILLAIQRFTKRRNSDLSPQFRANLVWLFCYATLVILSNEAVVHGALLGFKQSKMRPPSFLNEYASLLPLIVNLWIILFSIAHTLSSSDVLSPRFIYGKLRKSARDWEAR